VSENRDNQSHARLSCVLYWENCMMWTFSRRQRKLFRQKSAPTCSLSARGGSSCIIPDTKAQGGLGVEQWARKLGVVKCGQKLRGGPASPEIPMRRDCPNLSRVPTGGGLCCVRIFDHGRNRLTTIIPFGFESHSRPGLCSNAFYPNLLGCTGHGFMES
jgi:hypothetical protein